ncbi:hypothetical protein AAG906_027409 [Vitis piasezkii]
MTNAWGTYERMCRVCFRISHSRTYFVGNAPLAHMVIQPAENVPGLPFLKVI